MKVKSILMVGVGGQGIILSSDILAMAAMIDGHDVKKSEVHGMSQRGGSVFSHIRYGEKVFSPVIPKGEADIIFSLEEMETLRWGEFASADCQVIFLRNQILPSGVEAYPEGVEAEIRRLFRSVTAIDPATLIEKTQNKKTLNVAVLGVLSRFLGIGDAAWDAAIAAHVPKGTEEINLAAFQAGKTMA